MSNEKAIPTDAELNILNVLWARGESTVKEVHEALPQNTGYTTTLKFMQIMREKKLVERTSEKRPHLYKAKAPQKSTETKLLTSWIGKLTQGSAASLAMKALDTHPVSDEELVELRDLLNKIESKNKENL